MLESLFNKVAGLKACNFIEKRLQHSFFPVKFTKFLRTYFFTKHLVAASEFRKAIALRAIAAHKTFLDKLMKTEHLPVTAGSDYSK